mmetsp:Transcript_58382/g.161505  ORF Transcript_58382/g.161505 Transcript_58382/m.161505 type:complete len:212 (+) Transcript_58382:841-1476(+)
MGSSLPSVEAIEFGAGHLRVEAWHDVDAQILRAVEERTVVVPRLEPEGRVEPHSIGPKPLDCAQVVTAVGAPLLLVALLNEVQPWFWRVVLVARAAFNKILLGTRCRLVAHAPHWPNIAQWCRWRRARRRRRRWRCWSRCRRRRRRWLATAPTAAPLQRKGGGGHCHGSGGCGSQGAVAMFTAPGHRTKGAGTKGRRLPGDARNLVRAKNA